MSAALTGFFKSFFPAVLKDIFYVHREQLKVHSWASGACKLFCSLKVHCIKGKKSAVRKLAYAFLSFIETGKLYQCAGLKAFVCSLRKWHCQPQPDGLFVLWKSCGKQINSYSSYLMCGSLDPFFANLMGFSCNLLKWTFLDSKQGVRSPGKTRTNQKYLSVIDHSLYK